MSMSMNTSALPYFLKWQLASLQDGQQQPQQPVKSVTLIKTEQSPDQSEHWNQIKIIVFGRKLKPPSVKGTPSQQWYMVAGMWKYSYFSPSGSELQCIIKGTMNSEPIKTGQKIGDPTAVFQHCSNWTMAKEKGDCHSRLAKSESECDQNMVVVSESDQLNKAIT